MPIFRLVFATPSLGVLLTRTAEGWRFPDFDAPADWLAEAADDLRVQARGRFGIDGIALREQATPTLRYGLIEILEATALAGGELVDRDDPRVTALPAEDRDALTKLTADAAAAPPWGWFGWWTDATAWIDASLRSRGVSRTGDIRQRKAAWMGSSVLEVPCTQGALFFKATNGTPSEAAVLRQLTARHHPCLPGLVAADATRGWQITSDLGVIGPLTLDGSAHALRALGNLQRLEAAHVDDWRRAGCADRTLPWLAGQTNRLLRKLPPLMAELDVLTQESASRLVDASEAAAHCCRRLESAAVPTTVHHEDFRPGNVAWQNGAPVLFDWADTVLAHPFFSAHRYLDDVRVTEGQAPWDCRFAPGDPRAELRDAYLAAWRGSGLDDEAVVDLFTATRSLEPLYQLARYDAAIDVLAWARSSPLPEELAIARVLFAGLIATSREW